MEKINEIVKNYYNKNSKDYIENTLDVDMKFQYSLFEKYLKIGDTILEIGFGSGRDLIYFSKKYNTYGIDITDNFVDRLKNLGYENIFKMSAENFKINQKFDGIWACASLLHIKKEDLEKTFNNCYNHLKNNGIIYCSFKYGNFSGERNGRYFVDMNEEFFDQIIKNSNFKILEKVITKDVRKERDDIWLNIVLKKEEQI